MIIIGDYFDRVDTPEGQAQYDSLYKTDYREHIKNSGSRGSGNGITILKTPQCKYVVRVGECGDIYQVFVLEDKDEMIVYTDGCKQAEGCVFNSGGHAFFTIKTNGQDMGTYHISNSPYDMDNDAWEECGLSQEEGFDLVRNLLKENQLPDLITHDNIIFIMEL